VDTQVHERIVAFRALKEQYSTLASMKPSTWVPVHGSVKKHFPDVGACTSYLKDWTERSSSSTTSPGSREFECTFQCAAGSHSARGRESA
jgi:hypothetical protein